MVRQKRETFKCLSLSTYTVLLNRVPPHDPPQNLDDPANERLVITCNGSSRVIAHLASVPNLVLRLGTVKQTAQSNGTLPVKDPLMVKFTRGNVSLLTLSKSLSGPVKST